MQRDYSDSAFMSAQALKLTPIERHQMISVLKDMESGVIIDTPEGRYCEDGRYFDMGLVIEPIKCGAICCIAGWMSLVDQTAPIDHTLGGGVYRDLGERSLALNRLINAYPGGFDPEDEELEHYQDRARVRHAAIATRNFLTTGDPNWEEAMGDDA